MKKALLSFIALSASVITACKKGDTGGDASISAHVKHHATSINLPTVYVKFDAKELPSDPTNNYDLKIVGTDGDHVHIHGMRYGNYYLYATGYDSTIMMPVAGGIPIKIKWGDRKKEMEITIPVVE